MRKLPKPEWTILEWGHYGYDTADWNSNLALTKQPDNTLAFGNYYAQYQPAEMSEGKIGYFGICYKGTDDPPVTPILTQYRQPIGATLLQVEPKYQSYRKIFWWQVTGDNVTYTNGNNNPYSVYITIPADANHKATQFRGTWLIGWQSAEIENIIL